MTAGPNHSLPGATLGVLVINAIALIGFACAPLAPEYPLAVIGILAFLFVQAFLPACRIRVTAPLCPANIAQGYYWIQLVLVTVLVGYFDFSHGTLPYLPSKGALNLAIVRSRRGLSVLFCRVPMLRSRHRGPDPTPRIDAERCVLDRAFCGLGIVGVLADARRRRGIHRVCLVADRVSPAGG